MEQKTKKKHTSMKTPGNIKRKHIEAEIETIEQRYKILGSEIGQVEKLKMKKLQEASELKGEHKALKKLLNK